MTFTLLRRILCLAILLISLEVWWNGRSPDVYEKNMRQIIEYSLSKGILPILWELYPRHPNLLEASFDPGHFRDNYVAKPLLSREGGNVSIHRDGTSQEYEGSYGGKGTVFQELARIPCFSGNYPVIGSWMIYGEPAGIGIREDANEVTTNTSRFVPHLFNS